MTLFVVNIGLMIAAHKSFAGGGSAPGFEGWHHVVHRGGRNSSSAPC
jgi:hypothetical protein